MFPGRRFFLWLSALSRRGEGVAFFGRSDSASRQVNLFRKKASCVQVSIVILVSHEKIEAIIAAAINNPADVLFSDLCRVCNHYFGQPRQQGTSHRVYRTPWQGDPRVNIQKAGNKAKTYQVKQVLKAISRMEKEHGK